MIATFNNAKSIIQHQDKEDGAIIGKYLMNHTEMARYGGGVNTYDVYAIIDIRVRDNKARINIKPQSEWTMVSSDMLANVSYTKQRAINDMKALSESFHASMQKAEKEF